MSLLSSQLALQRRFEAARRQAGEALQRADLSAAHSLFSQAHEIAVELDDDELRDRAFCNLTATAAELGLSTDSSTSELRRILNRNRDEEICSLAAYHLARSYELRQRYPKALFYTRIALKRVQRIGRSKCCAAAHNQMGSILLAENRFDEAQEHLEAALALLPSEDSLQRVFVLDNLGYVYLIQRQKQAGFRCLFEGLRMLRRLGVRRWEGELHLSLCYGYLKAGRWQRATQHGVKALLRSEEAESPDAIKNALFLLGEVANSSGDTGGAYHYFAQLQRRFYPEKPFLPAFLLTVDVAGLVNVKS